ncbi:MAG: hypothetical protein KDM91_15300, partial [Verrucomicrobiae bacterium]|nr:hypothetical protein [Verrucomicrobiae bacterium]
SAKKAEPRVEVESWTRLTIEPDAARFLTRFDYLVKRAGIFDTIIVIPDGYDGVEATGDAVADFTEETAGDGTRTLTVKLRNRTEGRFSFNLTGRRVRAAAEEDAEVPVFSPQGVERHEGKVGLEIHTSLDPNTRDPGDLRQQEVALLGNAGPPPNAPPAGTQNHATDVPASSGIPGGGPLQIGFRYRGDAKPATVGFKLKEPQINAEVATLVEVREQLVRYRWTVDYDVLYAGVDTFAFSLPEEIAGDLRVDGQLIKETDKAYSPPESAAAAPNASATPVIQAGEGRKLWAVILRDKQLGKYRLTLSLDRPLGDIAPDAAPAEGSADADPAAKDDTASAGDFAVSLPEIRLEGVFRETGQVAVVKDDNLEILDAQTAALEAIDAKELRGELGRQGVFLAYKYRRHPLALDLRVSRNEFLTVPPALITYAHLTAVVSNDRALTAEVVYWVRNNAKQFLGVALPEGGRMVSDILVNGEPRQPMRRAGEDTVLIRLPSGGEQAGQGFPVRFVFEVPSPRPGDSLGWFGSLEVPVPALTDADVLQSLATLWLPDDYVYRSFDSAMRLPMRARGWARFRSAFDRLVPSLGPQIEPGLSETFRRPPPSPAGASGGFDIQIPAEGQRFELHRLDAPDAIRVGYRSRGFAYFWEALFCVLALAAGVWLLAKPARWRFAYFVGVGVLALIVAGAVSPVAASFWRAIFLGVLGAAVVWAAKWSIDTAKAGGIRLTEILGEWRKRRAAGAVASAPNPATQPAAPPLGAVKPKSRKDESKPEAGNDKS